MKFQELKDTYAAFIDYVTIAEAKQSGIIPDEYADNSIFPDYCECGNENIINRSLTHAMCSNPRCKYKLSYALSELFSRFGIKGIGDAICTKMICAVYDKLKFHSHLEILEMEYKDYPASLYGTVKGQELYLACQKVKEKYLTFPELVSMIGIPQFGSGNVKLLSGISSLSQFCDLVKSDGGVRNFCYKRGVYDQFKIFCLHQSLVDIMLAEQIFQGHIRMEGKIKINVCITGSLFLDGNRITRNTFIELCNTLGSKNGTQIIEVKNTTAKETCNYVIADYESTSSKYLAGKVRGVLITSVEFVNKIKEIVACLAV